MDLTNVIIGAMSSLAVVLILVNTMSERHRECRTEPLVHSGPATDDRSTDAGDHRVETSQRIRCIIPAPAQVTEQKPVLDQLRDLHQPFADKRARSVLPPMN